MLPTRADIINLMNALWTLQDNIQKAFIRFNNYVIQFWIRNSDSERLSQKASFSCKTQFEVGKVAYLWFDVREGWWEGSKSHRWRQCHVPASSFEIEMAHYCLEFNFSTNFEPIQYFRAEKVSHFDQKTRDQYFEEEIREKWMVRILSHFTIP